MTCCPFLFPLLERVKDPAERARFSATFEHALLHPEDSEAFDGPELKARAYFSNTRTGQHVGRSIQEVAADQEPARSRGRDGSMGAHRSRVRG
jgi:hypothetical protein